MKLILTSKVWVFIQVQDVTIVSAPSLRNKNKGRRLTRKASLTAVLTWERAQLCSCGAGLSVVSTGYANSVKIISKLDVIIREVGCIATTWICTKSFWFLRPTDELLSFRSGGRVSPGVQPRSRRLAVFVAGEPLSVGKGVLTPVFRITI